MTGSHWALETNDWGVTGKGSHSSLWHRYSRHSVLFFVDLTSFLISLHAPLISKWLCLVIYHSLGELSLHVLCVWFVSMRPVSLILSLVQSLETRLLFCTRSRFWQCVHFYLTHVQVFVHQANIMLLSSMIYLYNYVIILSFLSGTILYKRLLCIIPTLKEDKVAVWST